MTQKTQPANELVMDLQAVIVYLKMIAVLYPVAPAEAIKTIQRTIDHLEVAP